MSGNVKGKSIADDNKLVPAKEPRDGWIPVYQPQP